MALYRPKSKCNGGKSRSFYLPLLLLIAGCDQQAMLDRLVPDQEAAFARTHLGLYLARDADAIMSQLDSRVVDETFPAALDPIFDAFPDEQPTEVLLVGANIHISSDVWGADFTYQLEFSDRWLLAAVSLRREEGAELTVTAMNVQTMAQSLQEANAFDISGNGLLGWFVLTCTVLVPLFCIGTLVVCLRTPIAKRKWAWAIFTLVGVGTVSFNWATGQIAHSMMSVLLFGAAFGKAGPYAPVILSFAFPVGAIVFWTRRRELIDKAELAADQESELLRQEAQ